MHEAESRPGKLYVRPHSRFAGAPRPGEAGWMDAERARRLIERGAADDCSTLTGRLGEDPEWRRASPPA